MLWEVEITPNGADAELARVKAEFTLLTHRSAPEGLLGTARGYLLEGSLSQDQASRLMVELLVDPLVEGGVCNPMPLPRDMAPRALHWTVVLKPGVMDPVAESVLEAAQDLGIPLESVRTFRRYILDRAGL